MAISWKLWIPINRSFPMVSAFKSFDFSLGVIVDTILSVVVMLTLTGICIQKRVKLCTIVLLCCLFILILEDITRLQAWVYTQGVLLLILSQNKNNRTKSIFTGTLLLTALVYIWSGIQKMNLGFITQTFPWMLSTFGLDIQSGLYESYPIIYYLYIVAPLYELTIGIFLLLSRTRKTGIIMGISMHLFILLNLGPTGHSWNIIVWPWNFSLVLVLILIYRIKKPINLHNKLKVSSLNGIIILLFGIMPAFNFIGYWDSPLSGSLYSGTDSTVVFHFNPNEDSELAQLNIPASTNEKTENGYDSNSSISWMHWSMNDIQVPYYQSNRYFKRYAKKMCSQSKFIEATRVEITNRSKFNSRATITKCSCMKLLKSK